MGWCPGSWPSEARAGARFPATPRRRRGSSHDVGRAFRGARTVLRVGSDRLQTTDTGPTGPGGDRGHQTGWSDGETASQHASCWSVDFPALPLAFSRCRVDPRGRRSTAAMCRSTSLTTLLTLSSSSERSRLRWNLARSRSRKTDRFRLSWPCPLVAPPPVLSRCVHSRHTPANRHAPSGRGFHPPTSRSARVVSHHLDGLLRNEPAGLLHPATDLGVRRVSAPTSTTRDPKDPWPTP